MASLMVVSHKVHHIVHREKCSHFYWKVWLDAAKPLPFKLHFANSKLSPPPTEQMFIGHLKGSGCLNECKHLAAVFDLPSMLPL